jgi:hypothetical protein
LANRLSHTCRTHADDDRAKVEESKIQQLKEDIDNDEDSAFMREYMRKRLLEMQQMQWWV